MNIFKTSLLILTLGLSTAACFADGGQDQVIPGAQIDSTCPAVCDAKIQAQIEAATALLKQELDALKNNPAYQMGKGIEQLAELPKVVGKKIGEAYTMYTDSVRRHPIKTPAIALGGLIIWTALAGAFVSALINDSNYNRYWDNYYKNQAKRIEEEKRRREEEDHQWIQQQRRSNCGGWTTGR